LSTVSAACRLALAAFVVSACSPQSHAPDARDVAAADWFVDRAAHAGLHFTHVNGMSGELSLAEIMGAGAALFDYDSDGDLDAYVVQGGALPRRGRAAGPGIPEAGGDRLYRNDLKPGEPASLKFTDVTAQSGIDIRSYGMGVAAGDVDNDGRVDLYLTRLGSDVLLRNNGNGTFTDVTQPSGISDTAWSVAASFLDFDRDGWLDLYVGNYVRYDIDSDADCRGPTGAVDYCTPQVYRPMAGHLYRNRGNGTFADVTVAAGIAAEYGPALGSIAADLDRDGWADLYVANDGAPNQLWLNQRNGTFRNSALLAGVAVSGNGRPEGSMGVDAGDFDRDGDDDLVITNLFGEGIALYVNDGAGTFEDRRAASGLGVPSLRHTGFGIAWVDVDNDGWLDVLGVNGAVQMAQPFAQQGDAFPLDQPMQLLRNRGDGRFEDVTAKAGAALTTAAVGRGAAFGDVDNDGDVDVLVATNNGPLKLVLNQIGNRRHWVGLRLLAADGGRDALGARVNVVERGRAGGWYRARSDGSYASANDPRMLIGLGDSPGPVRIRIQWPRGTTEEREIDAIDRWITLREGTQR
jgi:hypothetical protein